MPALALIATIKADMLHFRFGPKAKRLPAEEPKVRNLLLNQRVSPVSTLISRSEWLACAGKVELVDREDVYLASTFPARPI